MWMSLLTLLLVAGVYHAAQTRSRGWGGRAEILLVYVLVGYCGISQIGMGIAALVASPDWLAAIMPRAATGGALITWAAFMWIGMGVVATLSIWLRGVYLVGPVVGWSIFWIGATYAHMARDFDAANAPGLAAIFGIFMMHSFVGFLLLGCGLASWRAPRHALADGNGWDLSVLLATRFAQVALAAISLILLAFPLVELAYGVTSGVLCIGGYCAARATPHSGYMLIFLAYSLAATTGAAGIHMILRHRSQYRDR